jgi:hypothetical protein
MKKIKGINTNFEIIKEDLNKIAFEFSEDLFDVYKKYGYNYKNSDEIYENCIRLIDSFFSKDRDLEDNDEWSVSSGGIKVFYFIHDKDYITYGIVPELDEYRIERDVKNFRS